jgi:hypothetical protein
MAFLSYAQIFAPYAPAEILVGAADVGPAMQTLQRLLGGESSVTGPVEAPRAPVPLAGAAPSYAGRAAALGIAGAVAAAAMVVEHQRPARAPDAGPRPKLEFWRVDDSIDPFATLDEEDIPEGMGAAIFQESVPIGGEPESVHFARIIREPTESLAATEARARRWLDGIALPKGARFGLEPVDDFDPDTKVSTLIGVRTFVLVGTPIIGTKDVIDASASQNSPGEPTALVNLMLSPDATKRFEEATRAWVGRRIAVVLDDEISSAPILKTVIRGGRLSVTMGIGDPEKKLAEAKELAQKLRP